MRKLIECIAILLYKKKYIKLRDRLIFEFSIIKINKTIDFASLSKLLISGEDHRFYYHIGFDILAIARAIKNRFFYSKVEGASTIEQQLVRVLTNDFEKTFLRKIQEIFLSTTVASIISKDDIPKIYLNIAHYGTGMNGLACAIMRLGITEQQLSHVENAAELVSRIKYPQPIQIDNHRINQIQARKKHLIALYIRHSNKKHFKIYGQH